MRLTFTEIKTFLTGVKHCEEQDGVLILSRFTPEQLALHEDDAVLYHRAETTPSVTLDFYTDSETISLVVGGVREGDDRLFSFDLYENGVMTACCLQEFPLLEAGTYPDVPPMEMNFSLQKGEKRVTVYFPWALAAKIYKVELSHGAFFRPHVHKGTWLALGDSITQGCRADHSSMTYVNQLGRFLDLRVLNHGIGGEVFHERNYLRGSCEKFDLITIAYGTNDFSKGDKAFFTRMPAFLKAVAEDNPETPIVVILPLFRRLEALGMDKGIGCLQDVRDAISREAAKYANITVVNGWDLVPHDAAFYAEAFMLHPVDLGFSQFAMNLLPTLQGLGF